MDYLKILAIAARLILASESDGWACYAQAVAYPPYAFAGSQVDCIKAGRFRTYLIAPTGAVFVSIGRTV